MKFLPSFCIKRPVFTVVINLILLIIGILGFMQLNTRFFPKYEKHIIKISAVYPGASAQLIETNIATPLEEIITGISGISNISSNSYQNKMVMTVTLADNADYQDVVNQLRDRVSQAQTRLPSDMEKPQIQMGWGDMPLLEIGFFSNQQTPLEIRNYLDRYVIYKLEQIPGVANVGVEGASPTTLQINLDPPKLAAWGLSVPDVIDSIQKNNIARPAGQLNSQSMNFPINLNTKLETPKEFNNIIIKNSENKLIHLKDIGEASLESTTNDQSLVTINGKSGILLTLYNATDANPLQVAKQVDLFLQNLKTELPSTIDFVPTFNMSIYMNHSIHEVYSAVLMAILCVVLVIFLFLGQLRAVLIPLATIPICLVGTFALLYLFNFTINLITLLALVLSIGLVVDDAIVMLENIHRRMEGGENTPQAALNGSQMMVSPVIAMTLTLTAVYTPIALIKSQAAHILQSFALTLAGAVLISGFVALTLTPMMASRLLRPSCATQKTYADWLEQFYQKLARHYERILTFFLAKRVWIIVIVLSCLSFGYYLLRHLPAEFMPQEDIGFVVVGLNPPTGANLTQIERSLKIINSIVKPYSAVNSFVSAADTATDATNGVFITLKPFKERHESANEIAQAINHQLANIPGLEAMAFAVSFGSSQRHPLEFSLLYPGDYQKLITIADQLVQQLGSFPDMYNIQNDARQDSQQYNISINRALASELTVSTANINETLAALWGTQRISTFNYQGKVTDVYLQANAENRENFSDLNQLTVRNEKGDLIPLSDLITIQPVLKQTMLSHYNRLRSTPISMHIAPGFSFGGVVHHLQTILPTLLPASVTYLFTGQAQDYLTANHSIGLIFILSFLFIYFVLSAQFESFIDPWIVLLSVPLSMIGALAALKVTGGSLNIYTEVGLVTLIGLIAKHGILITQFANILQIQGHSSSDAILEAAKTRLRPILMTTAAMVMGAVPLLLAGVSAASRFQIGVIIVAGLIIGTFFSLIVVPITYYYIDQLKKQIQKKKFVNHVSS